MRIAANQEKTVHKKKEEEKDEQANAQNTQKKNSSEYILFVSSVDKKQKI